MDELALDPFCQGKLTDLNVVIPHMRHLVIGLNRNLKMSVLNAGQIPFVPSCSGDFVSGRLHPGFHSQFHEPPGVDPGTAGIDVSKVISLFIVTKAQCSVSPINWSFTLLINNAMRDA